MVPSILLTAAVVALAQPALPKVDRYGDPLPPGAVARYGTVRGQFPSDIGYIALSPSGKRAAVCGSEKNLGWVHVVDTGTGRRVGELPMPFPVQLLTFVTETTVAVGTPSSLVIVWKYDRQVSSVDTEFPLISTNALVASPDGQHIAVSKSDGMRIFSYPKYEVVSNSETDGDIGQITFSPDGKWLLGVVPKLGVRLWDVKTGKRVRTWAVKIPKQIGFATDSKRFFVWGEDGLQAYPIDDDAPDPAFTPPRVGFVCDLRVTADGQRLRLLSGGEAPQVLEVDAKTGGNPVIHKQSDSKAIPDWAKLHPDGKTVIGGSGNSLRVWDAETGRGAEIPKFPDLVRSVFLADGKTVRSIEGGDLNTIYEWDATTGRALGEPKLVPEKEVAWGRRYEKYAVREKDAVIVYDFRTRSALRQLPLSLGEKDDLWFHTDAHDWLVVTRGKEATEFWDTAAGRKRGQVPVALDDNTSETFTADRRKIWVVKDQKAELLEVGSGQRRTALPFPAHRVCPDPDGRHVWVTVFAQDKLHRCDAATGEVDRTLPLPNWNGWIVVSPDGKRIAVYAERDKVAWVLDAETGTRTHEIAVPMHAIQHAAFSPDGTRLVTSGSEGAAYVWDLTRPIPTERRAEAVPAFRQASEALAALGRPDAAAAHLALTWLQRHPKEGAAALATAFPPAATVSEAQFAQMFRDLDDPEYKTRQAAEKRLEKLGPQAEAALRAELEKARSAEARAAVERLVARLGTAELSAEQLRVVRAVEAAERIGTAEAVKLLEAWSKGAEAALLTTEASSALERVRKSKSNE